MNRDKVRHTPSSSRYGFWRDRGGRTLVGSRSGEKLVVNFRANTLEDIRELQNVIERAVVLCDSETFSVDETWLKPEEQKVSGSVVPLGATLAEHEKDIIEAALADCGGQVSGPTGAAAKLGLPRQTLESKITVLGINKHRFKTRQTEYTR
jgi:transcriptional regulator with GAF, ATPase, and Fis domain